jgi:glutathione S-transferase
MRVSLRGHQEARMKLYYHPVSTTSRPIMMFAADSGITLDYQLVDLFTGAHMQPDFAAINPSQQVPVLDDDGFVLTECSAILKYLAEKTGSPAYPSDLRQRARVNERMDWLNTGLARDLLYGFCYPQSMAHHKRQDDATHANTLAWGRQNARRWLGILDEQIIGPNNAYLCGDSITLADYLGAAILSHGEVEQLDYAHWRNISRWLASMKARPNWDSVQSAFQQYWVQPCANNKYEPL